MCGVWASAFNFTIHQQRRVVIFPLGIYLRPSNHFSNHSRLGSHLVSPVIHTKLHSDPPEGSNDHSTCQSLKLQLQKECFCLLFVYRCPNLWDSGFSFRSWLVAKAKAKLVAKPEFFFDRTLLPCAEVKTLL